MERWCEGWCGEVGWWCAWGVCEYGEQCVEVVHAWRRVVWGVQKGEGGLGGGISLVCVCVCMVRRVCVCVCMVRRVCVCVCMVCMRV